MVLLLALSLQDQVEKYGSYVGIAAFFGLAVLSLLYFAQAREVKRLREWAGRAPERAREVEERAIAQAEAARRQPAPVAAAVPQPVAAATAAGGRSGTVGPAVPVGGAATAVAERPDEEEEEEPVVHGPVTEDGTKPVLAIEPPAKEEDEEDEEDAPDEPDADEEPRDEAEDDEVRRRGQQRRPAPGRGASGDPAAEHGRRRGRGDAQAARDRRRRRTRRGRAAPVPAAGAAAARSRRGGRCRLRWRHHLRARQRRSLRPRRAPPEERTEGPQTAGGSAPRPAAPRPAAAPLRQSTPTASPRRPVTMPPRRPGPPPPAAPAGGHRGRSFAIAGGVAAVVVALGVLAATQFLGKDEKPSQPNQTASPTAAATDEADSGGGNSGGGNSSSPTSRADTTVAVFNGTTINGLAASTADKLVSSGYKRGTTGDYTDQQRAASSVFYAKDARRQAREIGRELNISELRTMDAETQALAGENADIAVVVGSDKAP